VDPSVLDDVLAALASGGRPNVAEVKQWIRAARPAKASPSPKPASVDQDASFRQLVQLLKVVGAQKADDALREAFQEAAREEPTTVPALNVQEQPAARGHVSQRPAAPDADEIKDLDLSANDMREAA
jgi:hypothetical protein